jgi:hypothetical protein
MGRFRASDRVMFIGDEFDTFSHLTPYKMYTVVNTFVNSDSVQVTIEVVNDLKKTQRYKPEFFLTVQEMRALKLKIIKDKICSNPETE